MELKVYLARKTPGASVCHRCKNLSDHDNYFCIEELWKVDDKSNSKSKHMCDMCALAFLYQKIKYGSYSDPGISLIEVLQEACTHTIVIHAKERRNRKNA